MRMWMVNPKILCKKHLLGEHVESHMFIGHLKLKRKVDGYIRNNLLETKSIYLRHDELALEMLRRNYKHKTDLEIIDFSYLSEYELHKKIDRERSLNDLLSRCKECMKNYNELIPNDERIM